MSRTPHRSTRTKGLGTTRLQGNLWHDAATAVLMREHGVSKIYTRDTDFHRFRFLEPVDPLQG